MPELQLDTSKIYKIPNNIFVGKIDDKYLLISRDTANWLLLNNDSQLRIYEFLANNNSINELLNTFSAESTQDIIYVLTELEAKKFESLEIKYPQEHGMYIYLTNRCNQRCNHCYMYAGEELESELTTEEIKKLLKEFADSSGEVVTFTGGEATIRDDFVEIVSFAKYLKLRVCVLSNGLLWTPMFIDTVKEFIDEVQISLDGYDSKSYMEVRNTDTFNVALEAVERLVNSNLKVIVAVSPLLDTLIEHQEEYCKFAQMLSEKYKNFDFVVKFNSELMEGRNISPNEDDNKKYRNASNNIKNSCKPLSDEQGFALDHKYNTVFNNCGYGGLSISAIGDVYFCNLISKCSKQANIRTHSFNEILKLSEQAREVSDVNNLSPCNQCELKYLCGGGCRVKHFPDLVNEKLEENKIPLKNIQRLTPCSIEQKNIIYRLMIASNRLFYR